MRKTTKLMKSVVKLAQRSRSALKLAKTPRSKQVELKETLIVPRQEPEAPAPLVLKTREAYDGNTAFNLYIQEISQTPLLTVEDEIRLAKRIKRGDKAAREHMIKANLRLVVKIAREYEDYGLPLLDLINEGNIGLMKAVERFDPAKGAKLSTYAAWWIKQSIKRALANQGKTIRLPVHLVDKIARMRRTALKLQDEFGREPTDEELGEELGISAAKVAMMRSAGIRPASLDAPLSDDADASRLGDVVPDEKMDTAYQELEDKTRHSLVRELLKTLDPRELTILRYRFGLDGDEERTLEEVGQQFGITRERIRQLQNAALNKLRRRIEKVERLPATA
jgi:RNA polymerase primary sigma factor